MQYLGPVWTWLKVHLIRGDWEAFIDWMALSGINNVLAMTGQEEVAYKTFRKFGLSDHQIRGWFNGPALLTWSRGQNEYGSGLAGPLPRSWMKDQWALQRQILPRYRSLGIVVSACHFPDLCVVLTRKYHPFRGSCLDFRGTCPLN
jgi:alpha-N-acetylglucosaminidase